MAQIMNALEKAIDAAVEVVQVEVLRIKSMREDNEKAVETFWETLPDWLWDAYYEKYCRLSRQPFSLEEERKAESVSGCLR